MSYTACPNHPPGHVWDNGLACRWCEATRTPREAIESGLASRRGGSRDAARALVDAHRAEVLAEAIGRLCAIPVDCTALTGPVWYGTGWQECITALRDIADYQLPEGEAYPGELQRLRARMRELRAAALRREDLGRVQQVLMAHAAYEAEVASKTDVTEAGDAR